MLATEGLAEFEREQLRLMEARNQLRKIIDVQSGRGEPRSLEERLVRETTINLFSEKAPYFFWINTAGGEISLIFNNIIFIVVDPKPI